MGGKAMCDSVPVAGKAGKAAFGMFLLRLFSVAFQITADRSRKVGGRRRRTAEAKHRINCERPSNSCHTEFGCPMRRMMSKDDVVVVGPEKKTMIPRAKDDDSNVRLILIENFDFLFETWTLFETWIFQKRGGGL